MAPRAIRDPLLPPLAAFAVGIALCHFIWFGMAETLAAGIALVLLAMVARRRGRLLAYFTCLLALIFAGIAVAILHRPGRLPRIDAGPDETVIADGCVVDPPIFHDGRDQFTMELARHARARVTLHLRDGDSPPDLRYGQRVELETRIRSIHNFRNPGEFDFSAWSAERDIYWNALVRTGAPITVHQGRCGSAFLRLVFALRTAALNRIDSLYRGDAYSTGMMRGILLGENSEIEKIWTDDFRRTGTFHTLVVSGLHVGVLAAFFVFLLRVCFVPQMPALLATTIITWLYAVITGLHPPAIRAAAGLTLYLLARFFYRRGRVLNLLAAIAFAYLLIDPAGLFDPSFQLTFLAVAAIGALGAPLLDATSTPYSFALRDLVDAGKDPRLEPRQAAFRVELRLIAETIHAYVPIPEPWLLRAMAVVLRLAFYAWDSAVISTVVQIGVALPMAIYFHRISLSGLSANIIIVPLLAIAVPVGFTAVFTDSHLIAGAARMLLVWGQHVAAWHVRFEPALRVPDPPLWLSIASVAALLSLAFTMRRTRVWRWPPLAAVLAFFAAILIYPFPPHLTKGALELTAIDVGQGDSLFVAFPDGHLMLVDGGGFLTYGAKQQHTKIDTGEDVVSPYLWTREIRHIDVVVATHGHEDHIGGLPAIMDNFHPAELWTGANPPGPVMDSLISRARADGVRIIERRAGERLRFGGTEIQVLSPAVDYAPDADPRNDDSLVLRIVCGRRALLLEGDAEAPSEERMIADGLAMPADVLKVAHHGSRTSSTDPFLDAVQPKFAIISDGIDNLFHHPHRQALDRLEEHRARILRTDQLGLISIGTDGQRIWTENWKQDMQTQLLAAPPGR